MAGDYEAGQVTGDDSTQAHRACEVSWITPATPDSTWVFERALEVVSQANQAFYGLDLFGYTERLQLTKYTPGHFQNWHMDFGTGRYSVRKLTFGVQLSSPDDYEGGEFEVLAYYDPFPFPNSQGTVVLFPSFIVHRVKPLTAGVRHSLVGWIGGPHLR